MIRLPRGPGGADETVYRAVSVNGAWYNYYYDAFNRRRMKVYPSGATDEFFYDQNSDLLVDQGNDSVTSPTYHIEDAYVWLRGRPVLVVRGRLDSSWNRVRESNLLQTCHRNGDPTGLCTTYFPVTDNVGKTLVVLDNNRTISGIGEYEPSGQVNRVAVDKETTGTNHIYSGAETRFADLVEPANAGLLAKYVRVKFQSLDINTGANGCSSVADSVYIVDDNSGSQLGNLTGLHLGTYWTSWLISQGHGVHADLVMGALSTISGGTCVSCSNGVAPCASATGAVIESFEYRRYNGSGWYFPQLRFPGQYHDEETDLNQNWNRFYEPITGRYLESEPVYTRSPRYIASRALSGKTVPYYGYAGNNPLANTDRTGNFFQSNQCDAYAEAVQIALQRAGCSDSSGQCSPDEPDACYKQIEKAGGCDICPLLKDGQGGLISFVDNLRTTPGQAPEGALAWTANYADWTQVLNSVCDDPSLLASIMIHESMHICKGAQHISDPLAGALNQEYCGSVVPDEQ